MWYMIVQEVPNRRRVVCKQDLWENESGRLRFEMEFQARRCCQMLHDSYVNAGLEPPSFDIYTVSVNMPKFLSHFTPKEPGSEGSPR